jgi:hypothetical protein
VSIFADTLASHRREYGAGTQPTQFLTVDEKKIIMGKLRVFQKTADGKYLSNPANVPMRWIPDIRSSMCADINVNYATAKPKVIEKEVKAGNEVFKRSKHPRIPPLPLRHLLFIAADHTTVQSASRITQV